MKQPDAIVPGEKTIDTRDAIARLEYLRSLVTDIECPDCGMALTIGENDDGESILEGHNPDCESIDTVMIEDFIDSSDLEELTDLEDLESAGIYGWEDGVTLILESRFEDYARDFAYDVIEGFSEDQWPYTCIDWKQAANDLQMDYSSVDFGEETYLYRE